MRSKRRAFLGKLGTVGAAALAGCTGDTGDGDDGDTGDGEMSWPPESGIIEGLSGSDTAGLGTASMRLWWAYSDPHWKDNEGISASTVTTRPEAQSVPLNNEFYGNSPEDEHEAAQVMHTDPTSKAIVQIAHPEADYDMRDAIPLATHMTRVRSFLANPRTMLPMAGPGDDEAGIMQLTWDDIVAWSEENTQRAPWANGGQFVTNRMAKSMDPRLNDDNWRIIGVPGGGDARAAHERGELDCYFGSPGTGCCGHERTHFYIFQTMMGTRETTPSFAEALSKELAAYYDDVDGLPDEHLISGSTEISQEQANRIAQVAAQGYEYIARPETPEEFWGTHIDVWEQVVQDENFRSDAKDLHGEAAFNDVVGNDAAFLTRDAIRNILEDEEMRSTVSELIEY